MVSGMGCDFKDFDGDGWPDIFLTDLVRDVFTLFVNQGKGFFVDRTFPSGVGTASTGHSGWSTQVPRHRRRRPEGRLRRPARTWSTTSSSTARPRSTRRAASSTATSARAGSRTSPTRVGPDLRSTGAWRGVAVADLDNDGTLEVAVYRLNGTAALFVKKGGRRPQLDPAGPRGHEQQPGRHRRAGPAGAALGPHAPRARDHRERDLLRERQARALRARDGDGASPTSRSPGRAGSCSGSRSPRSTRCCTSWSRTDDGSAQCRGLRPRPASPASARADGRTLRTAGSADRARGGSRSSAHLRTPALCRSAGTAQGGRARASTRSTSLVGQRRFPEARTSGMPRPEAAGACRTPPAPRRRRRSESGSGGSPRSSSSRACSRPASARRPRRCGSSGRPTATASRPWTRRSWAWRPTACTS